MVYGLAIALALTLDVTGALHVYGLSSLTGQKFAAGAALVLVGIALGWLLVALPAGDQQPEPVRAGPLSRYLQHQSQPLQRLLTLLMFFAWSATARNFLVFIAPESSRWHIALFGVGAVALAAAVVRPVSPGWMLAGAVLMGTVVRLLGLAHVPIDPSRADMLPLVEGALGNLLAGQSPYTIYVMPWELPLTYLPVTWLAYLPPHLVGLDIRLTNLVAELLIGATLLWLASVRHTNARGDATSWRASLGAVWRREPALLLWAWVFLQPTSLNWSLATTGPVQWTLLSVTLARVVAGFDWLVAVALGLFVAATPFAAIATPFVLLSWLRAQGWRRTAQLTGITAAVAALFVVPFFLWSPEQFVFGAWRWFNDNELYPRLRWEMDRTWSYIVGFSGIFWRFGLVGLLKPLQMVLLLGIAALYWLAGTHRRVLAPLCTAALLLFTLFNPVLWPYLYNPALVTALLAVTVLGATVLPETAIIAVDHPGFTSPTSERCFGTTRNTDPARHEGGS